MFDMQSVIEQAKAFQSRQKEDLVKMAISSSSGGGAVSVVVNGHKEITKIEFRQEALRDADMLADMVLAALSGAYSEVDRQLEDKMPSFDNLDLSSLGDLLKQ